MTHFTKTPESIVTAVCSLEVKIPSYRHVETHTQEEDVIKNTNHLNVKLVGGKWMSLIETLCHRIKLIGKLAQIDVVE